MADSIKVGIIGGAGYTAGELTRILISHPSASIVYSQSESNAGNSLAKVHTDLIGETALKFVPEPTEEVDVVFLCKGHGQSKSYLEQHEFSDTTKIIDLSQDFRLDREAHEFVYGLPEMNHDQIKTAKKVANPGCFATAIQLALLPSIENKIYRNNIHISGITGSTGAGQALSSTGHFSWRHSNMSVYKPLKHQHLLEVKESFSIIDEAFNEALRFVPYRGNFTRGIIASACFETDMSQKEIEKMYAAYYASASFTHVIDQVPDLKMVVNSNKCLLHPVVADGAVVIMAVIDNLVKGASGQAVQNMNLMFGLPENSGLQLKTLAY